MTLSVPMHLESKVLPDFIGRQKVSPKRLLPATQSMLNEPTLRKSATLLDFFLASCKSLPRWQHKIRFCHRASSCAEQPASSLVVSIQCFGFSNICPSAIHHWLLPCG
eukprot:scpid107935/ scgid23576/ 